MAIISMLHDSFINMARSVYIDYVLADYAITELNADTMAGMTSSLHVQGSTHYDVCYAMYCI